MQEGCSYPEDCTKPAPVSVFDHQFKYRFSYCQDHADLMRDFLQEARCLLIDMSELGRDQEEKEDE